MSPQIFHFVLKIHISEFCFCNSGIYQRILSGKIFFTKSFDKFARTLVKKLLTADLSKRYGNLKNGADDIVKHKWYVFSFFFLSLSITSLSEISHQWWYQF